MPTADIENYLINQVVTLEGEYFCVLRQTDQFGSTSGDSNEIAFFILASGAVWVVDPAQVPAAPIFGVR